MVWLPLLNGQKSLMILWHSLSWWGRERVASSLAYKGGQYPIYDCLEPIPTQITENAIENSEVSTFLLTNIGSFLSISPYDKMVLCG